MDVPAEPLLSPWLPVLQMQMHQHCEYDKTNQPLRCHQHDGAASKHILASVDFPQLILTVEKKKTETLGFFSNQSGKFRWMWNNQEHTCTPCALKHGHTFTHHTRTHTRTHTRPYWSDLLILIRGRAASPPTPLHSLFCLEWPQLAAHGNLFSVPWY